MSSRQPVDTERVDDVIPDEVMRIETSTFEPSRSKVTARRSGDGDCWVDSQPSLAVISTISSAAPAPRRTMTVPPLVVIVLLSLRVAEVEEVEDVEEVEELEEVEDVVDDDE